MSKSLRDIRQEEFANIWLNSNRKSILNLCPRFGKIFTTINIMNKMKPRYVLIAYPDNKIKESWQKDFETRNYTDSLITYTTHLSLHKHQDEAFDLVVIDEIHLLSEAQIEACQTLLENNDKVLGLTGTLSKSTESTLLSELDIPVTATYTIEQAINEGVIVDYQITVIKVPLDNLTVNDYKGKKRTEKKQFDSYGWVINQLEGSGGNTMFLRLARMRIIQSSLSKLNMTRKILDAHKDERILVFCGTTKIADSLGIPSHHSKSKDDETFTGFTEGEGNHMAVVKIGNTGVTYKPLNRVIINYFDSNGENLAQKIMRCTAMEFDNPNKKANIYIITSDESVELNWLKKALSMFDQSKIKYL